MIAELILGGIAFSALFGRRRCACAPERVVQRQPKPADIPPAPRYVPPRCSHGPSNPWVECRRCYAVSNYPRCPDCGDELRDLYECEMGRCRLCNPRLMP